MCAMRGYFPAVRRTSFGVKGTALKRRLMTATIGLDWLDPYRGTRLPQISYLREFDERMWLADDADSWKLERRQHFLEEGFPSWDAFMAGNWAESMALYQDQRPGLLELSLMTTKHNSTFHRLRIIEEPLSPYLQWELHCLMLRAKYWERIRVLDAKAVRSLEPDRPLPELVSLCGRTLYHTLYTSAGRPDGAIRYTDASVIEKYQAVVRGLYDSGEDLKTYFQREVRPLPPPRG
jgi:hypothetical protein